MRGCAGVKREAVHLSREAAKRARRHAVREQGVLGAVADGAGNQHRHDEAVDGNDTSHDDGNQRLHHNLGLERAQASNGDAALGGADRGAQG